MYGLDVYGRVRRAVLRDGMSAREAARLFGLDRGTVSKMTRFSAPPGYRGSKTRKRTQMDAHAAFIDEILKTDQSSHGKQRHTAQRIYERLRDERGFTGGYTTVRDHVRPRRQTLKEAFVPLAHPPGHAQADFGEAVAILGGVEQKVRFFVMDLPHSDAIFVKAYHGETAEAFCDALPGRRLLCNCREGACGGVCVLRRSSSVDPVRQYGPGGGEDPRGWDAQAQPSV